MMIKPIIIITLGEPGGIGADICLDMPPMDDCTLVIIGDIQLLKNRAVLLNKPRAFCQIQMDQLLTNSIPWHNNETMVLHVACPILDTVGVLHSENATYVLQLLDIATDLCKKGVVS